jgi:fructokinase
MTLYVAIEAGGTKFVCGLGNTRAGSLGRAVIGTREPDGTFTQVAAFFAQPSARHGPPAALGFATFGPVELDHASAAYGYTARTGNPGWECCDVLARTRLLFTGATGLETEVNAASIAEVALHGVSLFAYVTVATRIGVGLGNRWRPGPRPWPPGSGACPGPLPSGARGQPRVIRRSLPVPRRLPGRPADRAGDLRLHRPRFCHDPRRRSGMGHRGQLSCPAVHDLTGDRGAPPHRPEWRRLGWAGAAGAHLRRTLALLAGYLHHAANADDLESPIVAPACREPSGLVGTYIVAERSGVSKPFGRE